MSETGGGCCEGTQRRLQGREWVDDCHMVEMEGGV